MANERKNKGMLKYPEIDGSWESDPLDLKCFRLDAELDDIYGEEALE